MAEQPPYWPVGAKWPDLTYAQRRAHFEHQLSAPLQPRWRRVLLAMCEHGCGWHRGMEIVDGESQRLTRNRGR